VEVRTTPPLHPSPHSARTIPGVRRRTGAGARARAPVRTATSPRTRSIRCVCAVRVRGFGLWG